MDLAQPPNCDALLHHWHLHWLVLGGAEERVELDPVLELDAARRVDVDALERLAGLCVRVLCSGGGLQEEVFRAEAAKTKTAETETCPLAVRHAHGIHHAAAG